MACPDGLDRIVLSGVTAFGHHGVLEHERRFGQTFVVDVSLGIDLGPAGSSDDLTATVNYAEVAEMVQAVVTGEPVDLIESLALRMVDWCLARPSVEWASVTVHKPQAPIAVTFSDVSVTIERSHQ
ncbi:dihydroneopterin aldolase [Aeromicrobium sp.]|uniref:dihydroneopterin aldolase n=1 Tax=Aeromicrobium sp. TaxID=1871063 RepID=UPI0040332776